MQAFQTDFLNAIKPGVIAEWSTSKVLPSVTAAQAILESDWGRSKLGAPPNHNLFGVKSGSNWTGQVVYMNTREVGAGGSYWVNAGFRKYASWADSIKDRTNFFQGSSWARNNYRAVIGETDYKKACWALKNAGYATDPNYAPSLIRVIESYNLQSWDKQIDKTGYVEVVSGKIDKLIEWFEQRKGKVGYSMVARGGPNSYDCSSAVYSALIYAGFLPQGTALGSTEDLYALEGSLLIPINADEKQRGDIFVSGIKGNSGWSNGHTGVYYGNGQIIHCTVGPGTQGIMITPLSGWLGGPPTYWYRLKGAREQKIAGPSVSPGADNKTEEITVSDVNNSFTNIFNNELLRRYGAITKVKYYVNVSDPALLKEMAETDLLQQFIDQSEVNLSVANLQLLYPSEYKSINLNDYVVVNNPLFGDQGATMQCVKKTIDIVNIEKSNYVLGHKIANASDYWSERGVRDFMSFKNDLAYLKGYIATLERGATAYSNRFTAIDKRIDEIKELAENNKNIVERNEGGQ
ncbi:peptidoglycan amidohydrolase family protein [Aerococcus sanguinicola]|uniref:peptidoglycan amidohydrolase family protein n=1 Tax=Aerococcus sanguinicola TaxID=119206 RepID=UPI0018A76D2C|nr:peptidoglycan amidohydrolase family protein [Aerococcus sanguinicola]